MSTRCQVGFVSINSTKVKTKNPKYDAILYFHSDGYPEGRNGILYHLLPFLQQFNQSRGLDDTEYAAAWCMHHMIKSRDYDYDTLDKMYCLSHGISDSIHMDIKFFYEVYSDILKVIAVRNTTRNTVKGTVLKEIPLDKIMDEFTITMITESMEQLEEETA